MRLDFRPFPTRALALLRLWLAVPGLLVPALHAEETEAARTAPRAPNAWTATEGFYPQAPTAWRAAHQAFVERAKQGGVDLLFLGDSLTAQWLDSGLWQKWYEPRHAASFGIGGDGTPQLLWRLGHGELNGLHPKVIVLMIGINNTWPNFPPEDSVKAIEIVVTMIRQQLPASKILLLGVLPIFDKADPGRAKIHAINTGLARLDDGKRVRFLDFGAKLLAPDGSLGPGLQQPDRIHLTPDGYEVWAEAMEPMLQEMLR